MSTRSGKRLHSTFHEETVKNDSEVVLRSEKKGRAKRCKENEVDEEITLSKAKKRANYVSYPSHDQETADEAIPEVKSTRKQKKNTLKEKNANIPTSETVDHDDSRNTARVTRQTRRFVETFDTAESSDLNSEPLATSSKGKSKKSKKKKSKNSSLNKVENTDPKDVSEKSKKKKKGKKSGSPKEKPEKVKHNSSNISTDSFHSAAGSPLFVVTTPISQKKNTEQHATTDTKKPESVHLNGTFEKPSRKTRNSTIKYNSLDKKASQISENNIDVNIQHVKTTEKCENVPLNDTSEKSLSKTINSSIKNDTFEKEASIISEDIIASDENNSKNLNATFDKDSRRKSSRLSVTNNNNSVVLNSTFEKASPSKTASLDTTYDKNDSKLNSTFNKHEQKTDSQKSSLISSDASNLTYDKVDSISITSDESQQYNIVNTTPVLIESSIDESALSIEHEEGTKPKSLEKQPSTPLKREETFTKDFEPVSLLKREGTFTKESPAVQKPVQLSTQKMSLPSPGCTPFSLSRSSKKPALNVTRSIEKSQGRLSRSSLAEPALSRQTRVMFCSPVNNPALLTQQKKTIIKSSMKGSNKSFVIQDTVSSPPVAGVKRSRSAAGGGGAPAAKRARPQPVVTASARTPRGNVNPPTPAKSPRSKSVGSVTRTKLPNFAALHRAEFSRMESLAECQQRKQQRARRLRTPTATLQVLSRASPQVPQTQAKEPPKKTETPSKESKLPTLMSLKPGFTKFGFKMNTPHVNPFTIPAKTEKKKEKRNGMTTRSTLPAKIVLPVVKTKIPQLNGVSRKEVLKQTVMREKSFASLSGKREAKRDENRTIIKGVRTNRRFDLQMKMRNIE